MCNECNGAAVAATNGEIRSSCVRRSLANCTTLRNVLPLLLHHPPRSLPLFLFSLLFFLFSDPARVHPENGDGCDVKRARSVRSVVDRFANARRTNFELYSRRIRAAWRYLDGDAPSRYIRAFVRFAVYVPMYARDGTSVGTPRFGDGRARDGRKKGLCTTRGAVLALRPRRAAVQQLFLRRALS